MSFTKGWDPGRPLTGRRLDFDLPNDGPFAEVLSPVWPQDAGNRYGQNKISRSGLLIVRSCSIIRYRDCSVQTSQRRRRATADGQNSWRLLKDEDFTRIPFASPFLDHLNDSYGALWQAMQIGTVCRPIFSGGRKGRLRASDSML